MSEIPVVVRVGVVSSTTIPVVAISVPDGGVQSVHPVSKTREERIRRGDTIFMRL